MLPQNVLFCNAGHVFTHDDADRLIRVLAQFGATHFSMFPNSLIMWKAMSEGLSWSVFCAPSLYADYDEQLAMTFQWFHLRRTMLHKIFSTDYAELILSFLCAIPFHWKSQDRQKKSVEKKVDLFEYNRKRIGMYQNRLK
jgi:hypothetical protein